MEETTEAIAQGAEPLEPNGFRDACVELLNTWMDASEPGEALEESFAAQFFQVTYEETAACWVEATTRFYAA